MKGKWKAAMFVMIAAAVIGGRSFCENLGRRNPYFFHEGISTAQYEVTYQEDEGYEVGETELLIQKLTKLEHGDLYAIKMKPLEVSWAEDYRFDLGYFYVQEDQILRVDSDAILPDEPEKLEQFLTEQGVIVCQAEEIPDPNPEERDVHDFLAIDEGLRVFRSYNNQVETGYYETIFWEKNIGLVRYRSGFGAGASSMDLQLKQLGGWRKLLPLRSKAAERDIWKSYME